MRIDLEKETVYVVRRGRSYEAPLSEVESAARVPSARVRFNLRRTHGVEQAESVTLRTGTRTSKRQRRFGDLTGARQPGAKLKTVGQREFGIDVTTQPFRVVRAWIAAVGAQDFDSATSLYMPGAVVHTPEGQVTGRIHIRALLQKCDWIGMDPDEVDLQGVDQLIRAECNNGSGVDSTFLVVDSGEISAQWLGVRPELPEEPEPETVVFVLTKGAVPSGAVEYATKRFTHLLESLDNPGFGCEVKLTQAANPATEQPAMAETTLDVPGAVIRAHTAAETATEAIDETVHRLRAKLEHRKDRHRHSPEGRVASPGQWRHGNLPSAEKPYFERPRNEREIVRHKSFAPDEMTVEEATWDMQLMDYDFFLFVELTSGSDSLLERRPDGEVVLHDERPQPLKVSEAIEQLEASGAAFAFFTNAATDRGNVVYRRYDGHYGLITPPVDDSEQPDQTP